MTASAALSWVLVVARFGAPLALAPWFVGLSVSVVARVALAMGLAFCLVPYASPVSEMEGPLALSLVVEVLRGAGVWFGVFVPWVLLDTAFRVAAPSDASRTMGAFATVMFAAVFVSVGGLRLLVEGGVESLRATPLGAGASAAGGREVLLRALRMALDALSLGVRLAVPGLVARLAVHGASAVAARSAGALSLYVAGGALAPVAAVTALGLVLSRSGPVLVDAIRTGLAFVSAWLAP